MKNSKTNIINRKHQKQNCLLTVVNGETTIKDYEFKGQTDITSLSLPNTLTSIGESAFKGCCNLKNIIPNVKTFNNKEFLAHINQTSSSIPNSVIDIGVNAFRMCKSLTNLDIPDSVLNIGDCAFYGCKRLSEKTHIGKNAFACCPNLTINFRENNIIIWFYYHTDREKGYTVPFCFSKLLYGGMEKLIHLE